MDATTNGNNFEKFPGGKIEEKREVPVSQDFEKAMSSGVPEFVGDKFWSVGESKETASAENSAETNGTMNVDKERPEEMPSGGEIDEAENMVEYDSGIADAEALVNYGLNVAAQKYGVENVVQKIRGFSPNGSKDPIQDFFEYMGIAMPENQNKMKETELANKTEGLESREGEKSPSQKKSAEGAFKAIADMKELILEVEGADPRYKELREGAKQAGVGYFEYAVKDYGTRGLTELFQTLKEQREKDEEREENKSEANEEKKIRKN